MSHVQFRSENYIGSLETSEKFDTITCLGTLKWIHLNFGDIAVKGLFHKVHEQLNDGGLFIMDISPWKSYKKSKVMSKQIKDTYHKIQMKPHDFDFYLTRSVGFRLLKRMTNKGLKRETFVYEKV